MSKTTEIINKYTAGEATLEETNAALAELGAGIHLEPGKHELTAEETAAAKAETAANANGFGLLEAQHRGGREWPVSPLRQRGGQATGVLIRRWITSSRPF